MRPANARANAYVPTTAELKQFQSAKDATTGQTAAQENHWLAYVTGRPGLRHPSTDDLIQWTAHKWGIPEDELRALVVFESWEHQTWGGDLTQVPADWLKTYPRQAKEPGNLVWLSMGIAQIKWLPDGSVNVGTQRLRWESTAFNLDYLGATVRFYYDGDCRWCKGSYHAGDKWGSLSAWNTSKPWYNQKQRAYIASVKAALKRHDWTQPGFFDAKP
jgi:hypothetical protein